MRTIQKKIKFSKGQISEKLLERQDLELVDSSASEITNLVSTPYGSIQKRAGTIDIGGYEETVEIDAINNNVGSYGYRFIEATMKDGGWYQSGDISGLSDDSEVFTIDLGSKTKAYEFDFQMYFNRISNYGDTGLFITDVTDGVLTRVWGYSFQNIKTPLLTPKATAVTLTDMSGSFTVTCESSVFTEEMTRIVIYNQFKSARLSITEFVSATEVKVSTTDEELDVLTSNSWSASDGYHTEVLTFTIITATGKATTTGEPFSASSLYNYMKIGTSYCWIIRYVSTNAVIINIADVGSSDLSSWDYIVGTRFGLVGRTDEATGSGAIISIPYTTATGGLPNEYLDIISGGSNYIETTYLYTIEQTVDTLVQSTCMVQKSDNGSDWTDVEEITITNSLLDGGDTKKKIVIDDSVRYIRVISDAVQGMYYIGGFNIIKYDYRYIRIEPFIFNDAEKYLIIFSKDLITIYDGISFKRVPGFAFTETQINQLKQTQKEDVMVITHPDFTPIELSRGFLLTNDDTWTAIPGWSYSDGVMTGLETIFGNPTSNTLTTFLPVGLNIIHFEVEGYVGGDVGISLSTTTGSGSFYYTTPVSADGVYNINYTVALADFNFISIFGNNFTGKIKNIYITNSVNTIFLTKYVYTNNFATQDGWTLGNNWTYDAGGTQIDATGNVSVRLNSQFGYKAVTLLKGNTYKIKTNISNTATASVNIGISRTAPSVVSDSGREIVLTATADGAFEANVTPTEDKSYLYVQYVGTGANTISVDDISVELISTQVNWIAKALTLKNIPKFAFNGETTTPKTSTLTPDVTEGLVTITSGASDFTEDSVGQYIDGGGGRVKITDYVSATKVRGVTIIPFYTVDPFSTWKYISGYETVWSATRGYPTCCLFYQGRLWFGGSKSRPSTIWASRIDDFVNFKNVGNYSNDAIDVTIDSVQSAEILALYPNRGIQVFCEGSEWIIPEGNLTPDGITITRNTANGIIRGIEPVDISGTTLFLDKNGKSLLSFVYSEAQNAYVTSQASILTNLIDAPIDMDVDYNSQANKANYLYIVKEDGTMAVACILIDHQINSFVNFETVGEIKSICVLGNRVYVVVTRDGGTFIEYFDEDSYVDCRNVPLSKIPIEGGITLVTVDSKFIGETLDFYNSNGVHLGQKTINGSAKAIVKSTAGTMYFGYPIEYSMTSNKIAVNGQTGSIRTRISEAVVETYNTTKLNFCGSEKTSSNNLFKFNACTSPNRDTRFSIVGSFDKIEVLSILLRINYGTR